MVWCGSNVDSSCQQWRGKQVPPELRDVVVDSSLSVSEVKQTMGSPTGMVRESSLSVVGAQCFSPTAGRKLGQL